MLQVVQSSGLMNMSRTSRTKATAQPVGIPPPVPKSKDLHIDTSLKIGPDKKKRLSSQSRERIRASFLSCAVGAKSPVSPAYGSTPFEFPDVPTKTQYNCLNYDANITANTSMRLSDSDDPTNMTILESLKAKLGQLEGSTTDLQQHSDNHLKFKPDNEFNVSNKMRTSNNDTVRQKPPIWKSISTFSLRTLSFRRKNTSKSCSREGGGDSSTESNSRSSTMERSCNKLSNSVPGDERLSLANISSDPTKDKPDVPSPRGRAQSISSQLGIKSRRKSTDDGGGGSKRMSTYATSEKAEVIYGTLRRRNTGRFVTSTDGKASAGPLFKRELRRQGSSPSADEIDSFTGISKILQPSTPNGVRLVRILKLDKYLMNRWITGLSITEKNDLIVVDLRAAYVVDLCGNLIRTIGTKGSNRLIEPIGAVALGVDGRLAFSDHADQCMKIYTSKGNHLLTECNLQLKNIAGIAYNRTSDEIFIAGTDRKNVLIYHADGRTENIPQSQHSGSSPFQHPYSIAFNAVSGDIIVGDDYSQSVTAIARRDGRVIWQFRPSSDESESTRQFFPSAICTDQDGYVFIADLYNEKVYMLDVDGVYIQTLLTCSDGLRGNPGAMTTDGRGNLFVADEEKTVKIFQYRYCKNGGESTAQTRNRFSFGPETLQY